MTSVLNVDTIADKAGTGPVALTKQTTIKAFCQAPADNASITSSFNIASLTDVGAGNNQPNLTNSMSSSSYGTLGTLNDPGIDNGDSAPVVTSGANSASQYENNVGYVHPTSANIVALDYKTHSIATGDLA